MAKTEDMATDEAPAPAPSTATPEAKEAQPPGLAERLQAVVSIVEKAVKQKDTRMMGRLLRQTALARPLLSGPGLLAFLKASMPADMESSTFLQAQLAKVRLRGGQGACRGPSRPV
jgi:hypothetical protein